ncbi:hypothetical protein ACFW08_24580 [Streptomyces sp. NPDC058960]
MFSATAAGYRKTGGVDRIARTADFTTKIRQAVVSQSRYHIEGPLRGVP